MSAQNAEEDPNAKWLQDMLSNVFKPNEDGSSQETSPSNAIYGGSVNNEGNSSEDFWVSLAGRAEEAAREIARKAAGTSEGGASSTLEEAPDPLDTMDLNTLSVKELKELITQAGLSFSDCSEKNDLKARAHEAMTRLHEARDLKRRTEVDAYKKVERGRGASAAAHSVATMDGKHATRVLAGLDCICVGEKRKQRKKEAANTPFEPSPGGTSVKGISDDVEHPDFLVFCFHGYQATAASLATLVDVIRASVVHGKGGEDATGGRVVFVLPQSPGAGWWDIDFASYAFAMAMGEETKARVLRQVPSGVLECRAQIAQLVYEARLLYAPPPPSLPSPSSSPPPPLFPLSRTYFMGFSQGAMLALDTALHLTPTSGAPATPAPQSNWWAGLLSGGADNGNNDGNGDEGGGGGGGVGTDEGGVGGPSTSSPLDGAVHALDAALESVASATALAASATGIGGQRRDQEQQQQQQDTRQGTARDGPSAEATTGGGSTSGEGDGETDTTTTTTTTSSYTSPVGGCVLVSGFLMDVDTWGRKLGTHHRDLRVLQLHGVNDALIPFGTAKWLQSMLSHYSKRAVFVPHGGGHDIPPSALTTISGFLATAMVV